MSGRPVMRWTPFPRKAPPRRFPVPKANPKIRRKIIPWPQEDWHVVKGDYVRKPAKIAVFFVVIGRGKIFGNWLNNLSRSFLKSK